jgi:hypothetical protein
LFLVGRFLKIFSSQTTSQIIKILPEVSIYFIHVDAANQASFGSFGQAVSEENIQM